MLDSRSARPRRRNGHPAPRRRRKILAIVSAIVAVLALFNLIRLVEQGRTLGSRTGSANTTDVIGISSAASSRQNFGYSVIPGGAWDAHELSRAIERDPVVADHYRDLNPATMRAQRLRSDRLAYVSYRVDDGVYWTKRKVRIRGGETILTNGQIEIRSRCGNCISLEPMLPTSADEPDESQFDALENAGPVLMSWNLGPTGPPFAVSVPPGDLDDTPGPSQLVPVFPFGIPIFPGGPVPDTPGGSPPGSPPVGVPFESPPTGPPTAPIGPGTPPTVGGPPVVGGSPDTGPLTPLVLDALLSDPNPPAVVSPLSPDTAVPEPGTFLLLGSGIAGLLARRWRSRSKRQPY